MTYYTKYTPSKNLQEWLRVLAQQILWKMHLVARSIKTVLDSFKNVLLKKKQKKKAPAQLKKCA